MPRARICKRLRSPGIVPEESIPPPYVDCAGILEQSMGTRNRVGIGLSYRAARLDKLGSSTHFLAPIDCYKIPAQVGRYDKKVCRTDPPG